MKEKQFFKSKNGTVKVSVAIEAEAGSLISNDRVQALVDRIAGGKLFNKGGWIGTPQVIGWSGTHEIPKNAMTLDAEPGVFVWIDE